MKTVKSILVLAILLVSSISFAQPPGGGGQQGGPQGPPPVPNTKQIKEMVSNLAKEISLSSEQETSVLKIYNTHFEKVKAKTSGNSRPKREEMVTLQTNFENEVKTLLSKEQISKYEAYLKKQDPQKQRK